MKNLPKFIASVCAVSALCVASASAQVITYVGENAKVPATTNNSAANYYLYEAAALPSSSGMNVSNLPSYVTAFTTLGTAFYGSASSGSYSDFTLNGTEYVTGLDTFAGNGANQAAVTFTLTGSIPSSFDFTVLTDNIAPGTSNATNDTDVITVTGTGFTSTPASDGANVVGTGFNDLYTYNVTGGAAGDTITVSVETPNTSYSEIGGILFNDSVPEPSTWALMFAGLGALVVLARRKQNLLS